MFPELDRAKLDAFLTKEEALFKRGGGYGPKCPPGLRVRIVSARRASGAGDESLRNEMEKALDGYLVKIRDAARTRDHRIYTTISILDEFGDRENAIRVALILTRFNEAMEVASEMLEAHKHIMSAYMADEWFRTDYQEGLEVGMSERDAFAFFVLGQYKEGLDAYERSRQFQQKLGNELLPGPYFGREVLAVANGNEQEFVEEIHRLLNFYNCHLNECRGSRAEFPFACISASASLSLARYRDLIKDIGWLPPNERRWILWYWL